jgi:arylsulfatase A-like enzyme
MRRFVFWVLSMALGVLVVARALLPEPERAQEVMAGGYNYGYNLWDLDLSLVPETAGSALVAELNSYYLFRTPTAQTSCTGAAAGKNLIVICGENWRPSRTLDRTQTPTLYRLGQEGVRFSSVYRPDWYQGMDGREFALLTGLVPTNVEGQTALLWVGEQDIALPYALGNAFHQAGYTCYAYTREEAHRASYQAMGFDRVEELTLSAADMVTQTVETLSENAPFLAYYVWPDGQGEEALSQLLSQLKKTGLETDTVVCLLTGDEEEERAQLYLWGAGVGAVTVNTPCSELDVVPTLLNLFGLSYDSRFLSGTDLFAPSVGTGQTAAVVSLAGSAYADWVTEAGRYDQADRLFYRTQEGLADNQQTTAYVAEVCQSVYDRYVYARKALACNYFQLVLEG